MVLINQCLPRYPRLPKVRVGRGNGIPMERVVKTLELEGLLDRRPKSLSGGEQQRVALARAIVAAPRLLLLDEPLTAVEASLRDRIATFIERVMREFGIPTVLVSHNRSLVDRLATRVIFLENGRILENATLTFASNDHNSDVNN